MNTPALSRYKINLQGVTQYLNFTDLDDEGFVLHDTLIIPAYTEAMER